MINKRGVPYLWGAKGQKFYTGDPTPAYALDCSGAATVCLKDVGAPNLTATHNTDKLWQELAPVEVPLPGDLAFYGGRSPTDVEHVEMVVAVVGPASIVTCGASGGGSRTTTLELAQKTRAMVKSHHTHLYRPDFRGFRSVAALLTRSNQG